MPQALSLTDLTTTVNLNDDPRLTTTRYAMQTASPQQWAQSAEAGDLGLQGFSWANVTETLEILFDYRTSTLAALQATVATIQRLLSTVQFRQSRGVGARVFLVNQLAGEATAWRSELLAARLTFRDASDQIPRLVVEASLLITRRYYWEANSETQLQLTSSETTTPATSATFYNNDDSVAAATNYVHIAAAQVTGSLPAPLRLRITNTDSSFLSVRNVHIANTVFNDPATFDPFLLGSEADGGAAVTWAVGTESLGWRWESSGADGALTNARLADLGGRYFRILLAISSGSTDVYYRPLLEAQPGVVPTELYPGKLIAGGSSELIDIGSVPIPPAGYDVLGAGVALRVNVMKTGGGSLTLDFAQLTPAGEGLYRKWSLSNYGIDVNESIEDDGIEGRLYATHADGLHYPIVRGQGSPILVWPGVANRLRILLDTASGWTPGQELSASAWMRPRRLDI